MRHGALVKQSILVIVCAAFFFASVDAQSAWAAFFGGCIGVANVQLLRWRRAQVRTRRGLSAADSLKTFYGSALERFVLVAAVLAVGMGWLELEALPLLIGFAISQLAVLFLWNESGQTRAR